MSAGLVCQVYARIIILRIMLAMIAFYCLITIITNQKIQQRIPLCSKIISVMKIRLVIYLYVHTRVRENAVLRY